MAKKPDIIIGIDAGTSVLKAVAFQLDGTQIGASSVKNTYAVSVDGAATQSLDKTWDDCAAALLGLADHVEGLAQRTAAIGVTGQGDGTWLIDGKGAPSTDAWLWLDARAAPTVDRLTQHPLEESRFHATGTGLNTCQQGAQLAHMKTHHPASLDAAATAFHCKDWLYFKMTGIRATDPSEASFTFGDFRTRQYSDTVIEALGLSGYRHLLPDILDGTQTTHALSDTAAAQTGLKAGTPVSLGFVDMIMTALGAGIYTGQNDVACSAIGSTGVHMKATSARDLSLGADHTGYVLCLPCDDIVAQTQTNMAATLNIDWILDLGAALAGTFGQQPSHADMIERVDHWLAQTTPGDVLYHPYISEAGERGPFVDANARANLAGLHAGHRYPDLVRAVVEGLGMAARDCYSVMGNLPKELRLTGGAARSRALREILSAALGVPVRVSKRDEAGAAGCAMMAAVAVGAYDDMRSCIEEWVTPLLGTPEQADATLVKTYTKHFAAYTEARRGLKPTWLMMAQHNKAQIT